MSVISYIKLIEIVDDFATQHMQVQRFQAEFSEQLPNFATKSEAYPILFMAPVGSRFATNEDNYTVRFYCFDVIQKDRANINNIISDTNLILNDLKKWFIDGDNYVFDIIGDPTATPINNGLLDYVAGWTMDVTFNVSTYCYTEIPFSGSPLIPSEGVDTIYSRYLDCDSVTACTTFQDYIQNAIENISGGSTTFSGGTVTGPTNFLNGLTATTISATTYFGLTNDNGIITYSLTADTNNLNLGLTGSSIVLITPTNNYKITGITGGVNGRSITLTNSSNNYFLFIETDTTSSSAGNRISNKGNTFIVLSPNEQVVLSYYNSQWNTPVMTIGSQFDLFDDFTGSNGSSITTAYSSGPFRAFASGTQSSVAATSSTSKSVGVQRYLTGTGSTTYAYSGPATVVTNSSFIISTSGETAISRFKNLGYSALSDITNRPYQFAYGHTNQLNLTGATSKIMWYYDYNSPNYQCIVSDATNTATVDSGLSASTTDIVELGLAITKGGGGLKNTACFYYTRDGVINFAARDINTFHPSSVLGFWTIIRYIANGTATAYFDSDYLGLTINKTRL